MDLMAILKRVKSQISNTMRANETAIGFFNSYNFNDYTTSGTYSIGDLTEYTNGPNADTHGNWGNLLVLRGHTDTIKQIYYNYSTPLYAQREGANLGTSSPNWYGWTNSDGIRNAYYCFSTSLTPIYGEMKSVTQSTNLPPGIYLFLTQSDLNHGYDLAKDILVIYISGVSGGRLIYAPQVRGTTSSGGGTIAYALIEMTSSTNSITYTSYGYIDASYNQNYNIVAIRLF